MLSSALNALWPEWVQAVQGAAPALKGKAVHWFADAATNAYALPPQYFVAGDTQPQGAIGGYISRLHAQSLHVDVAFRQAQDQVNQLVAAAAAKAAAQRASQTGGAPAGFAPPPQSGMGQAAQTAAGMVQVGGGGYARVRDGTGAVRADRRLRVRLPGLDAGQRGVRVSVDVGVGGGRGLGWRGAHRRG